MAVPRDKDAKRYYFAAAHRLADARVLLDGDRPAGAVYLAGYCVECALKALILVATPARRRPEILPELMTHSFVLLRHLYASRCGGSFPREVTLDLAFLGTWTSDMRYDTGGYRNRDAEQFLAAVERVWVWTNARI